MINQQRLKDRRLELGMTLEDVGNLAGMHRSAIQKYEKGIIKNTYISTVEVFARALRCSPAYLIGWVDDPYFGMDDEASIVLIANTPEARMIEQFRTLNEEGQEKVVDYLDDLSSSGKYKKDCAHGMGAQEMA